MNRIPAVSIAVLFSSSAAMAQGTPGDANFCRRYADTVATAVEDASKNNPACLNPRSGVHSDRQSHMSWCLRTPGDKVEGASTHIRRLASKCTQNFLPAPEEYGGYAIIGSGQFEQPYGQTRGWEVKAAFAGRLFMYCVASNNAGNRSVKIGVDQAMPGDHSQWQLAVPLRSRKDWQGRLEIDGREPANRAGADVSGTIFADWTIAWLNMGQVAALRNGKQAVLGVGKQDFDFSLVGIAAAITKIEECRSRKGVVAAAAAPAAPRMQVAQQTPARAPAFVNAPTIFKLRSNPGLCLRNVGGTGPSSSDLVLARCQGLTGGIFHLEDKGGAMRLDNRNSHCASVNRMPEPPEDIMMIPCRDSRDRWRYDERSGQIRNGDNYCFSVDRRAFRAGAKIVGTPCRANAPEQQFEKEI